MNIFEAVKQSVTTRVLTTRRLDALPRRVPPRPRSARENL